MAVTFARIEISNYRSCVSTELQLAPFTALVGRNNCGKSNCLNALQWVVRKGKLGAEDFNDEDRPVVVVAEFANITDEDIESLGTPHRARMAAHVRDGVLRIKRTQARPNVDSEWSVLDPESGEWKPNPGGIDNAIIKLFPDPIRIGAMEDAEEDASKAKTSTTMGKLLAEMLASIEAQHQDELAPFFGAILSKVGADSADRFASLGDVDESINGKIAELFPGIQIKLDFPVPTFKDLIKDGTVKVYEDGGRGRPFGRYGHGAQRAIQMAMVRHLADLKRGEAAVGGATLLLVDEPELFMHPFAVEQVREALRALSEVGYQVVFSTHSAQMILAKDARNALLLRKEGVSGTTARPRLESVVKQFVEEPTHQSMHLFSLTNAAQILFSDHVVLTEGKTELRLLPALYQEVCGKTLGQSSIALVSMGTSSSIKKGMEILDALGIPSRAVVDLDFALQHGRHTGLLAPDDVDIDACRMVFRRLQDDGLVTLDDQSGLPTKKHAVVSPAKAYELLASDGEGRAHVAELVRKLRAHRVWLWPQGAIEKHLGIEEKKESAWLDLQVRLANEGLEAVCVDPTGIRSLIEWMQEPWGDAVEDRASAVPT